MLKNRKSKIIKLNIAKEKKTKSLDIYYLVTKRTKQREFPFDISQVFLWF